MPIIWPSNVNGRQVYCSVACIEKVAGVTMAEPLRSRLLAGEKGDEDDE